MELKPWTEVGIAAVHGLVEVCERADEAPFLTSLTELEYRVGEPHFDPGTDAMVVVDGGDLLGWATVWHEPSGERLERCHLSGSVHPDHRGRGVGSRLLAWQVERGKAQLGAYDHDLPRFLRTFERAEQRDAHALLEDHGFAAVRWFEELLRTVEPLDAPEPTGIQIVPWDDSLSEAVRTVKNGAFGDHWGSTPTGEEAWAAWIADPMVRLDLSRIALDDGRVVGYSINATTPRTRRGRGVVTDGSTPSGSSPSAEGGASRRPSSPTPSPPSPTPSSPMRYSASTPTTRPVPPASTAGSGSHPSTGP
jgi:mycothiol synthase